MAFLLRQELARVSAEVAKLEAAQRQSDGAEKPLTKAQSPSEECDETLQWQAERAFYHAALAEVESQAHRLDALPSEAAHMEEMAAARTEIFKLQSEVEQELLASSRAREEADDWLREATETERRVHAKLAARTELEQELSVAERQLKETRRLRQEQEQKLQSVRSSLGTTREKLAEARAANADMKVRFGQKQAELRRLRE